MVWISGGNSIHKLSWCAVKQAFSSFPSHNLEHSITCSSNFWFKRSFSRNQNFLFSMCWYQWAHWVWKRVRKFISFLSATSPEPPPHLPPKKLMLGSTLRVRGLWRQNWRRVHHPWLEILLILLRLNLNLYILNKLSVWMANADTHSSSSIFFFYLLFTSPSLISHLSVWKTYFELCRCKVKRCYLLTTFC